MTKASAHVGVSRRKDAGKDHVAELQRLLRVCSAYADERTPALAQAIARLVNTTFKKSASLGVLVHSSTGEPTTEEAGALAWTVRSVAEAAARAGSRQDAVMSLPGLQVSGLVLGRSGPCIEVRGPRRHVLMLLAGMLCRAAGPRLIACPECGTLFVKTGKLEYCQRACRKRRYQRDYRRRHLRESAEAPRRMGRPAKAVAAAWDRTFAKLNKSRGGSGD